MNYYYGEMVTRVEREETIRSLHPFQKYGSKFGDAAGEPTLRKNSPFGFMRAGVVALCAWINLSMLK